MSQAERIAEIRAETADRHRRIAALWLSGLTVAEIAPEVGMSRGGVATTLTTLGVYHREPA